MDKNKELEQNAQKLQEIKASLDKTEKEFKQIRADVGENANNEVYYKCMDACYQMVSSVRQYVYTVEDRMYRMFDEHSKGHLPKIHGAEKMQNALETLGIDGDYSVQKPTIWVQANRNGTKNFIAELNIPKK